VNYRRAMVLCDLRADPAPALSALRRVAPNLEGLVLVLKVRNLELTREEASALEAWRLLASEHSWAVELRPAPQLGTSSLVELAITEDVELLVAGSRSVEIAALLAGAARRLGLAWLWPSAQVVHRPITHLVCAAIGDRSRAAILEFLREHGDPALEVSAIGVQELPPRDLAAALAVAGIRARVAIVPRPVLPLRGAHGEAPDLVVLARAPIPILLGYPWPAPVLLVPWRVPSGPRQAPLDVTDAVELCGAARTRVEEVTAVGTLNPAADAIFGLIQGGRVIAEVASSEWGDLELPPSAGPSVGVVRLVGDGPPDPLAAVEQRFDVLRPSGGGPGTGPLLLFDASLSGPTLGTLRAQAAGAGLEPRAVRLRPTIRASAIRERLIAAELPSWVLDARAILDEGGALDVSEANDRVRLLRVAARLQAGGYPVAALYDRGQGRAEPFVEEPLAVIDGNRIEVELDNTLARRWLLEAIAESRDSICLQVYMAADDEVGRAVEAALIEAARRGVVVRVLVDSLHGLHGSFGTENPLLSRLAEVPGIEARVVRPLTRLPSMTDVKQRDHRKIVVADGKIALIGGRNLSHEYYTGFEEASLDPAVNWRQVPWLDAGARVTGPAVGAIAAAFLEAWIGAGGAPFAIGDPPSTGSTAARVVVHRGLADARTLEVYLELIDEARSHLYLVHGFPLALEIQHAFHRALRRGVRVRVITGHLTPMHDGIPFSGPWSAARLSATEFVHSRLDPLVEAGGEVYLFAQPRVPSWAPDLGAVFPHVHAKLISADGRRCAVGSANFDVTSCYWESELMIVVEDPVVTAGVEDTLERRIAGSIRVDRDDPEWRERARRRTWMRRWPGVLAL
jgi:phosphatidylserine/phosphatidylglycerophosphate/cardiolipin synthase-like enzyme